MRAKVGGIIHDYNRRGLRDRDYPDEPAAGVTRVLAIGDSITFAQTLPLEATYVKELERLLNGSGEGTYEVLDGGVSGYNACQEEAFLRQIGLTYHPQIVLWQFCLNDLDDPWDPSAASNTGYVPLPRALKQTLREHSYTWNFLRTQTYALMQSTGMMGNNAKRPDWGETIASHYDVPDSPRLASAWGCVERAARLVKSRGGEMVVVIFPFAMQTGAAPAMSDGPFRQVQSGSR